MSKLLSKKLIVSFLVASAILIIAGAMFKIMHWQVASIVLCLGMLLSVVFIVLLVIFFVKAKIK